MGDVDATPEVTQGKKESGDPSCNSSVENLKGKEVAVMATSMSSSSSSSPSSILDEEKHEVFEELILPEQRGGNDAYRRLNRAFSPMHATKIHADLGYIKMYSLVSIERCSL